MKLLPDWLKNGYLRVIDPVANWLVRRGVHPNTITVDSEPSVPSLAASFMRRVTFAPAVGFSA